MPENPMEQSEIDRKFLSLSSAAVGAPTAQEILMLASSSFRRDSAAPLNALPTAAPIAELAHAG